MNRIEFLLRTSSESHVDVIQVLIDGVDLVDLVRQHELPMAAAEGSPQIAGQYGGLTPGEWFDGTAAACSDDGRVAVLGCECGIVDCWPLIVRVVEEDDLIRWEDFGQPHRPGWSYASFTSFTFSRPQYQAEVSRIRSLVALNGRGDR